MIFIVARFTVRPEYSENFPELVRDFTEETRREPGNLWFEWSRSLENPDQYVLVEAFRDGEAGAAHVQSEHFKRATRNTSRLLAETPEVINVEVPGTQWFPLAEMAVNDAT